MPEADTDGNPTGKTHVYAIDASGLGGMLSDDIGFDVRGKYAVVFAACVNPDTAVQVLQSLFGQLTGPAPDSLFVQSLEASAAQATAAPDGQTAPAPQASEQESATLAPAA
jgi:hypothetical protein